MEAAKLNYMSRTIFFGGLAAIMVFALNSCAKKVPFQKSSVVPAAEGNTTVKKDKNNNYVIKIHIKNLAEIERIQPPKESYVVWVETEKELTKNIGRISSSNRLNVSFETVSTLKPTRIFITAEEDGGVQKPGSMVVLTTEKL